MRENKRSKAPLLRELLLHVSIKIRHDKLRKYITQRQLSESCIFLKYFMSLFLSRDYLNTIRL